jgi:hypothetical protein
MAARHESWWFALVDSGNVRERINQRRFERAKQVQSGCFSSYDLLEAKWAFSSAASQESLAQR